MTAFGFEVDPGRTLDIRAIAGSASLGAVVLDGFIAREITSAGRASDDLLGPEDLIDAAAVQAATSVLPHAVSWTAISRVRLALLDDGFLGRVAQWPEIAATLFARAGRPAGRLLLCRAIATLPSTDARLLATLWAYASQWGIVTPDGVVLRIALSHERLARLVGARRPTVTAVVGRLRAGGMLERTNGAWLLLSPPVEEGEQAPATALPHGLRRVKVPSESGVRRLTRATAGGSRDAAVRELRASMIAQRAQLQETAARHARMVERLQQESGHLIARHAELTELARRHGVAASRSASKDSEQSRAR